MPLLTYLSPALKLNLSSPVGATEFAKAVGILSSATSSIEGSGVVTSMLNHNLLNAIYNYNYNSELLIKELKACTTFDEFDENTWILLHVSKMRCDDSFVTVLQKITELLAADTSTENAIQARLFLMSHLSQEAVIDPEWIAAIFASNDAWACFALLSHPKFTVDAAISGYRTNIDAALKHATCVPYTGEEGKTKFDSLLWVFMKSTGISAESKKKLLSNIAMFNFSEEEIRQWPIEVLATLVTLSNDISDESDLGFRAALFRSYILEVPTDLSSAQKDEIASKSMKKRWNREEEKNAALTMLQGNYFVIIDKFLGVITVPALFNAIQNIRDLAIKLNKILMLKIVNAGEAQFNVANRFLGSFFPIIWGATYNAQRSISQELLLELMSLDVFIKYFDFPLSQKAIGRVATNFQAMLQANDEFFIRNFFGVKYYETGIKWHCFSGNYFLAFIKAIVDYGDQAHKHSQLVSSQVTPVQTLAYIFSARRTEEDLHSMSISLPEDVEIFVKALTHYFAPALIEAMNTQDTTQKEVSYKRIRRTADLVKLLPPTIQRELYENDTYILFRAHNRNMKYAHQLAKLESRGLGREPKKEAKMHVLNWLINNFSDIKYDKFEDEYPPMQIVYDLYGPDESCVTDIHRVESWFRNVILQNRPGVQALAHGFGLFGTVEHGKKGSKMAETLVLFSDEFLHNLLKGTRITLLEIWNAAFPARRCSTDEERIHARNMMIQCDIYEDDVSSVENNFTRTAAVATTEPVTSQSPENLLSRERAISDCVLIKDETGWSQFSPKKQRDKDPAKLVSSMVTASAINGDALGQPVESTEVDEPDRRSSSVETVSYMISASRNGHFSNFQDSDDLREWLNPSPGGEEFTV